MSDFYNTLGINKNATPTEIKKAYRELAKEHHPYKGGDKEKFQKIQEAYDTLSDPQKKNEYDNPMSNFFNGGNQGFPFGGGNQGFPFGGININNFFRGGGGRNTIKKADHQHSCVIQLKDVYKGITKTFNLSRDIHCKTCKKSCTNCNGNGIINNKINLGPIIQILEQNCPVCNGSGRVKDNTILCTCSNGIINEKKTIEINIPKGVENGKQYFYEGWGEQITRDGDIPGNLIIVINIENDNNFERNGLHLKHKINISFKESIVGKKIKIPYFDEDFELNTQEFGIINPKKEYIITRKGLQNTNNERGNMYVKFEIKYPE